MVISLSRKYRIGITNEKCFFFILTQFNKIKKLYYLQKTTNITYSNLGINCKLALNTTKSRLKNHLGLNLDAKRTFKDCT